MKGGGRWAPKVLLHECPRCRGDLVFDRDIFGMYLECLQCGWVLDLDWAHKLQDRVERVLQERKGRQHADQAANRRAKRMKA